MVKKPSIAFSTAGQARNLIIAPDFNHTSLHTSFKKVLKDRLFVFTNLLLFGLSFKAGKMTNFLRAVVFRHLFYSVQN